jgi:uncharacterized protein YbbK (DUF523 family)/uncharacterized protein YbgA (DUF1722 family)
MDKSNKKPNVLMSSCIELDSCRFNGQSINDDFVKRVRELTNSINFCPEVMAGMGVPRKPISLYSNGENNSNFVVQQESNIDWTDKINNISQKFIDNLEDIDGIILKSKSPSCGVFDAKIRDIKTSHVIKKGPGLFAQKIIKKFPNIIIEDEKRLTNNLIRDNFISKLYLIFNFRTNTNNINDLIEFQKNNKYLIMMFSSKIQKELGNIVAKNKNHIKFEDLKNEYNNKLCELKLINFSVGKCLNVLDHIYGYLKDIMSKKEKDHYFKIIELYKSKKLYLITITSVLEIYILKYEIKYLESQSLFHPYPTELLNTVKPF